MTGLEAVRLSDLTILYVEDDELIAAATKVALERMGFKRVLVAQNLAAALDWVESTSQTIDLALLDLSLGNGERTTELGLKLRDAGVGVLFATGYTKDEVETALHSFEFLMKPVSAAHLEKRLIATAKKMAGQKARQSR